MLIHHDFNEIVYARFGTLVVVYGILLIICNFLELQFLLESGPFLQLQEIGG